MANRSGPNWSPTNSASVIVVDDSSPSATLPSTYSECARSANRWDRSFMNSTGPVNFPDALSPSGATTRRATASAWV